MENATKALLIAAAILIAIILISLGIAVVRQGQDAVQSVDMSEAEINAHNSKFLTYEGENVSTAEVNALIETVLSHNRSVEIGRQVLVEEKNEKGNVTGPIVAGTTKYKELTGMARYKVKCVLDGSIIKRIHVSHK